MERLRTQVFLLSLLLAPVSCKGFTTEVAICYCLDGFLISYCIIATALFFREKVCSQPSHKREAEDEPRAHLELEGVENVDPYQVLEPTERKRKTKKTNNFEMVHFQGTDRRQPEPLNPGASTSAA